jgi:hypothetical protein
MPSYDDPLVRYDDPLVFYDDPGPGYPTGSPSLTQTPPSIGNTSMEYWEITLDRAQKTLPVWQQYIPTVKVNGLLPADLAAFIAQFEPLAQTRNTCQDIYDTAVRAAETALLKMKILGTRVPAIIDAQIDDNEAIADGLTAVYRISPRSVSGIKGRARKLHTVWVKANTLLAAMVPANPPITRIIQGVSYTAAMLDALELGYDALVSVIEAKEELLNVERSNLRALDRATDVLNKNFYKFVKNSYDPGSPVYEALSGIPVEGGAATPEPVDIHELVQGGDDGLHVLVSYEPGGGAHATTKEVEYKVEGVDADFGHAVPIDPSGNTIGPFAVAQVVRVRTKVSNSDGSRTSAVRTITIENPI